MLSSQKITEKQISSFGTEIDLVDSDLGNSKLGIGIIMMLASFVVTKRWKSADFTTKTMIRTVPAKTFSQNIFTPLIFLILMTTSKQ